MTRINIGGVPEHFNLPWHLAISNNTFQENQIDLCWRDYPGGTGDMCEALRTGEIDVAIILTEGIVKDIINGNPSKIIQTYVKSPLVWGIHVDHEAPYKTVKDLKGTIAAISRSGSGSHLMAFVNAEKHRWDMEKDLKFKTTHNISGALSEFENGTVDYLLWEKFTTKPWVDNNQLRRIDECLSPWPCFVIAARQELIDNNPKALKKLLEIINAQTDNFKSINDIDRIISESYNQKIDDVKAWLEITEWSQELITATELEETQHLLYKLQIINNTVDYKSLVCNL